MKQILILIFVLSGLILGIQSAKAEQLAVFANYDPEIDSKSFTQAEPVIIMVVVTNPDAMNERYANMAYGSRENKVKSSVIGNRGSPWTDSVIFKVTDSKGREFPVSVRAASVPAKEARLDGANAAQCYFFISPEESFRFIPGDYTVSVTLAEATEAFLGLKMTAKKNVSGKASTGKLLKFGRYELLSGRFEQALNYAQQILSIEPENLRGMNLMGDALEGLGRYKEAREVFLKAVDEYFRQYPPDKKGTYEAPDLLMDKAMALKNKL